MINLLYEKKQWKNIVFYQRCNEKYDYLLLLPYFIWLDLFSYKSVHMICFFKWPRSYIKCFYISIQIFVIFVIVVFSQFLIFIQIFKGLSLFFIHLLDFMTTVVENIHIKLPGKNNSKKKTTWFLLHCWDRLATCVRISG